MNIHLPHSTPEAKSTIWLEIECNKVQISLLQNQGQATTQNRLMGAGRTEEAGALAKGHAEIWQNTFLQNWREDRCQGYVEGSAEGDGKAS